MTATVPTCYLPKVDRLNMIEGDLEVIEAYTYNPTLYRPGYPQPMFQFKQLDFHTDPDHVDTPDDYCSICTGDEYYWRQIERNRSVHAPIRLDGRWI